MPKRIIVIGLLFCLAGVLAIWDVVSDLSRSRINLNFAVLLLPVGIGLLRGKASSQWWARFWIILGYIACGLGAILSFIMPGAARAVLFNQVVEGPRAVPYVVGGLASFALLFYVIHQLLYSKKASDFFESRDK